MSQQGFDDPITVRDVCRYLKIYQDEFNATLQNIPTKDEINAMKEEGFAIWALWQKEIQDKLKDVPTKQDLQAVKEEEDRLRKQLYLAIVTIVLLVSAIIIQINLSYIGETTDRNDEKQHDVHKTYALGTLGNNWLHNHTEVLLLSEREGNVFLQYPIENNMSTFPGFNIYLLLDSEAAKLQIDQSLHSINIKSATKLTVFIHYGRQSDATLVIPADKCAYEYIIPMHTFCDKSMGKISLFAPHNDAQVTITFRQVSGLVEFNDKLYKSGDYISLLVPRQKILTIGHNDSLAGTTIYSTIPICVLAGTGCKTDKPTCKAVVTTVLPVTQLSRSFIVPNVVQNWSMLQLVSAKDSNKVIIYHYGHIKQEILKMSQTYHTDLVGREPMVITSDRDMVVTVLAKPTKTDPFLLWIVGIDQYQSSYQFYIPYYKENFIHEMYVICKTNLKDELRLNNHVLFPIPDSKRVIRVGGEEYQGFRLSARCCINYVMKHKHGVPFGLYIFGYANDSKEHSQYASYGYPAGISLR